MIMSTAMPRSARAWKTLAAMPGWSGMPISPIWAWSRSKATPVTALSISMATSFTRVPGL